MVTPLCNDGFDLWGYWVQNAAVEYGEPREVGDNDLLRFHVHLWQSRVGRFLNHCIKTVTFYFGGEDAVIGE